MNKCLTFVKKGYIIGVRWEISVRLQLNRNTLNRSVGDEVSAAVTIPDWEKYSFDIALRNIPWRTTNNFMLLGVRPFLFSKFGLDEKLVKFSEKVKQNDEKMSGYIVEG